MELKSAEREVNELESLYERIRGHDPSLAERIPALLSQYGDLWTTKASEGDGSMGESAASSSSFAGAGQVLEAVESLRSRLDQLREGAVSRLEKRRVESDPVTGRPRFGEQTLARVNAVLRRHRRLCDNLALMAEGADDNPDPPADEKDSVIGSIRRAARLEEAEVRRREEIERELRQREEHEHLERERLRGEEERRKQEEVSREEVRVRAEQVRQAEEARLAAQRVREEAEQADRLWARSVGKGMDAVREQLSILLESTASDDDPKTRQTAIGALYKLFTQIVAHPEEPNYRRIRRDHAQFNADIGRHKGGKEVLIAAGFELGAINGVPCFLSNEPNIETDMDGWATWFDLLKGTLALLEEQLLKL
jgi:hypothetical protein